MKVMGQILFAMNMLLVSVGCGISALRGRYTLLTLSLTHVLAPFTILSDPLHCPGLQKDISSEAISQDYSPNWSLFHISIKAFTVQILVSGLFTSSFYKSNHNVQRHEVVPDKQDLLTSVLFKMRPIGSSMLASTRTEFARLEIYN